MSVSQSVSQDSCSSDRYFKPEVPYIKRRRCTHRRRSLRSYTSLFSKSCDLGKLLLSVFPAISPVSLSDEEMNSVTYLEGSLKQILNKLVCNVML